MIRFEKFDKLDYERLISWIDSEELMIQFSGKEFTYPVTNEQLDNYISAKNRLIFKTINKDTNEVIGHAELNNIDNKNRNARICRVLIGDVKNRNKGFGNAIINELVRIGFVELKLHRIDLGVFNFNLQAIKCYESCGFEIEGKFKEISRFDDNYWSVYNMSILNKEI
jgi:RimJ/RimL family protein N-acetyltransferase